MVTKVYTKEYAHIRSSACAHKFGVLASQEDDGFGSDFVAGLLSCHQKHVYTHACSTESSSSELGSALPSRSTGFNDFATAGLDFLLDEDEGTYQMAGLDLMVRICGSE